MEYIVAGLIMMIGFAVALYLTNASVDLSYGDKQGAKTMLIACIAFVAGGIMTALMIGFIALAGMFSVLF